jgi:hypothetical protein
MAGQKGRSCSGGKRKGAGRPKGAVDAQPRFRIAKSLALQKWEFAKRALPYADRMLDVLVAVANNVEAPEATRVSAADKVLDRVLGKAPAHGDVAALHHIEIVYRSAAEIRQGLIDRGVPEALLESAEMRQELLNRGVPEVLLDYSPKDSNDSNDE